MGTEEFLRKILPEGVGYCVLAVFRNGLQHAPQHKFYRDIGEMARDAVALSQKGINVYHACAVYGTDENRKQSNTVGFRSQWLDLDVKAGEYSSQKEAAESVLGFCAKLGLPQPMLVSSGKGLHCYWPYTQTISKTSWDKVAALFRAALDHFGVKHDPTRTTDSASVLRPVGSLRIKDGESKPVRILRDAQPIDPLAFGKVLKAYCDLHAVAVVARTVSDQPKSALSSGLEESYPPSSASVAAQHCPAMAEVWRSGGDVPFGQWRAVLGVLKSCTDAEEAAQVCTAEREATGHGKADWRYQFDTWTTGPATCQEIGRHTAACAGCVHREKIKSPIQLGVAAVAPSEPVVVQTDEGEEVQQAVSLPAGFRWTGGAMQAAIKNEDGLNIWITFSDMLVLVIDRVRAIDGQWSFLCETRGQKNKKPEQFTVPSWEVNDTRALMKTLGKYELHPSGKTGPKFMQEYIRQSVEALRAIDKQRRVYPHMGWQNKDNIRRGELDGSFVLGDKLIRPHQPVVKALLSERVAERLRQGLGEAGTAAEWVDLINKIYNRPGAEAHQFCICAAFGSLLVRLALAPQWHGIPIALSGDTGSGKTTTAMVACSAFGNPNLLSFSTEGETGDTMFAIQAKHGSLNSLPFVLDELTGRNIKDIRGLLYGISNGQARDRATIGGTLQESWAYWDGLCFMTSNDALRERLREIQSTRVQDANRVRMLEIEFPSRAADLFNDINFEQVVQQELMAKQYGKVGEVFAQYIVNNLQSVKKLVDRNRVNFKIDDDSSSAERFFKDCVVAVLVGGTLANKIGLLHFDMEKLKHYSLRVIQRNRAKISEWEDVISKFIMSLYGRTVVTERYFPTATAGKNELPMEKPFGATLPVARRAVKDRLFMVSVNYLTEWCQQEGHVATDMRREMDARGWFLRTPPENEVSPLRSLTTGTGMPAARGRVFVLNYTMVEGYLPDEDNVVNLPRAVSSEARTSQDEVAG